MSSVPTPPYGDEQSADLSSVERGVSPAEMVWWAWEQLRQQGYEPTLEPRAEAFAGAASLVRGLGVPVARSARPAHPNERYL